MREGGLLYQADKLARASAVVTRYGVPEVIRGAVGDARHGLYVAREIVMPKLLDLCGADLHIHGRERVDFAKGCVLASNHESTLDIPALFVAVPADLFFVAKAEIKWIPIIGQYVQQVGMILINRRRRKDALKRLQQQADRVAAGMCVATFPEGRRMTDGRVHRFKKGAFVLAHAAGVPVVPVAIVGARNVYGAHGPYDPRPGRIDLAFGDPVPTKGLSQEQLPDLIADVHRRVVALHIELGGGGAAESLATD